MSSKLNPCPIKRSARCIVLAAALATGFAAWAQDTGKGCAIENPPRSDDDATIVVKMSVVNGAGPCKMARRFGDNPATSLVIRAMPVHGTLSSDRSSVSYTPNRGFVGKDVFDVQWFGIGFGPNSRSKNVRTKVDVTVRAASDEPDAAGEEPKANMTKPGM